MLECRHNFNNNVLCVFDKWLTFRRLAEVFFDHYHNIFAGGQRWNVEATSITTYTVAATNSLPGTFSMKFWYVTIIPERKAG